MPEAFHHPSSASTDLGRGKDTPAALTQMHLNPTLLLAENPTPYALKNNSEVHTPSSVVHDGTSTSNPLSWAPAADENHLEDTLPPPRFGAISSSYSSFCFFSFCIFTNKQTGQKNHHQSTTPTPSEYVLLEEEEEHCLNGFPRRRSIGLLQQKRLSYHSNRSLLYTLVGCFTLQLFC